MPRSSLKFITVTAMLQLYFKTQHASLRQLGVKIRLSCCKRLSEGQAILLHQLGLKKWLLQFCEYSCNLLRFWWVTDWTHSLWACSCYSGCITLVTAPVCPSSTKPELFCNIWDALSLILSFTAAFFCSFLHFSENSYRNPFWVNRSYKWPGSFCLLPSSWSRCWSKDNYSWINSLSCHQNNGTGILPSPS